MTCVLYGAAVGLLVACVPFLLATREYRRAIQTFNRAQDMFAYARAKNAKARKEWEYVRSLDPLGAEGVKYRRRGETPGG